MVFVLRYVRKILSVKCLTQVAHVIYKPTLADAIIYTEKDSLPIP